MDFGGWSKPSPFGGGVSTFYLVGVLALRRLGPAPCCPTVRLTVRPSDCPTDCPTDSGGVCGGRGDDPRAAAGAACAGGGEGHRLSGRAEPVRPLRLGQRRVGHPHSHGGEQGAQGGDHQGGDARHAQGGAPQGNIATRPLGVIIVLICYRVLKGGDHKGGDTRHARGGAP
eukprot:1181486-Prorocentrum_minimum.AAC.1